jgi:hypothetical protein
MALAPLIGGRLGAHLPALPAPNTLHGYMEILKVPHKREVERIAANRVPYLTKVRRYGLTKVRRKVCRK